jgi:hypothetical protein
MARARKHQCVIGKPCAEHDGMVHGKEAEELRRGIEELIAGGGPTTIDLMRLLERVDARDSLAYLEGRSDD